MKILRPRTFLNLVLIGFTLVSVPLGVGLWTTLTYIERVTATGLEVVDHAVSGTRDSEILSEYLRNEERSIRLFTITSEELYLTQAQTYHNQTNSILTELLGLPLVQEIQENIKQMRGLRDPLQAIFTRVIGNPQGESTVQDMKEVIATFSGQHDLVQKIRGGIQDFVESEVDGLKTTTADAQKALVTQTIIFIMATILMMAIMAFVLAWPIRQLNKSVERLGNGDFKTPVLVSGPLDIETVGQRLDWLRQRLDTLEQEKTKFLAHVSHELKTPLASIREGAALLSEELVGDLNEKQQDVASILVNNSILLQHLIENIINFNMAQAGQKSIEITNVDVKAIVEKAAEAQSAKMIGRDIKLDLRLDEATVHGDCKQVETIFENLFSNAVRFSPEGGVVGCRLKCDNVSVACIIFDSGPGIATEEKDRIFQPFYQVDSHSNSMVRSSGLGLAIVKEYVKRHNGTISLLNPGEPGARFGVTFPVGKKTPNNEANV